MRQWRRRRDHAGHTGGVKQLRERIEMTKAALVLCGLHIAASAAYAAPTGQRWKPLVQQCAAIMPQNCVSCSGQVPTIAACAVKTAFPSIPDQKIWQCVWTVYASVPKGRLMGYPDLNQAATCAQRR